MSEPKMPRSGSVEERILLYLYDHPGPLLKDHQKWDCTQKMMSRNLDHPRPHIQDMVLRLIGKGWVEKVDKVFSGRGGFSPVYSLTDQGRRMARKVRPLKELRFIATADIEEGDLVVMNIEEGTVSPFRCRENCIIGPPPPPLRSATSREVGRGST